MEDTSEEAFLRARVRWYTTQQTKSNKEIKRLRQKHRRLKKRSAEPKDVIKELTREKMFLEENAAVLESMGATNQQLLKRQVAKRTGGHVPKHYSRELRAFALTLHFYSPRAYEYVRDVFDTCLLHPRTLKKWYQTVDRNPGYPQEALKALELKATENSSHGIPTLCS